MYGYTVQKKQGKIWWTVTCNAESRKTRYLPHPLWAA